MLLASRATINGLRKVSNPLKNFLDSNGKKLPSPGVVIETISYLIVYKYVICNKKIFIFFLIFLDF